MNLSLFLKYYIFTKIEFMNIIKKRFGYINMTSDLPSGVEETVISFEKQIENLTEENDKLKLKIKSLENEIELLKIKNDFNLGIIKKNNIIIENCCKCNKYLDLQNREKNINLCDTCIIKEKNITPAHASADIQGYENLQKEIYELKLTNKKIYQDYNDLKSDYIKIQNIKKEDSYETFDIENNKDFISLKKEKEKLQEELDNINTNEVDELQQTIDELNEKLNKIPNEEEIENKYKKIYEEKLKKDKKRKSQKNNNMDVISPNIPTGNDEVKKDILKKYPIIIYRDINENEVKEMVASECAYIVKYQYEIAEKTNKDKSNISLSEIIDYIVLQENLTKQEKQNLSNKFERCEFLHRTYGDKLNIFKFELTHISNMTKDEYKIWLDEFNKKVNIEFPDSDIKIVHNVCDYEFKSGKKKGQTCNNIECRIKAHKIKKID